MKKRFFVIEVVLLITNIICCLLIFYGLQKIKIENLSFTRNSKIINLTNLDKVNVKEIADKLNEFYLLKEVDFGKLDISKEDKAYLEKKYPEIKFTANIVIDLYGMSVRDDVTYLDLSEVQVDDKLASFISKFKKLKEVNLTNQNLTVEEELALMNEYPNINFDFTITVGKKKLESSAELVDLSDTNITYEEVKKLLPLFPNIKSLDLSNTPLTNEECNQFRIDYPDIETNWVVHLGRWSLRTDDITFSVLIQYYDYVRMTSADIEVLKYCTKLKALDLGHQAITDISVIGNYLPDLRILILADNKITDITPISKLKHLHYLELFINPVSDLSPLKENKELVDLNLANLNRVTDVTPLLELPKLERLWVNNMGIGYAGIKKLQETYPDVQMATTGNQSTHQGWRSHPRYFQMIDMFHNNYYGDEFSKYD